MANREDSDEEQETLVYMDFNTKIDSNCFTPENDFKLIGLDEEKPILQFGRQIFQGKWSDTNGTHVFLEETNATPQYDRTFSEIPEIHMSYACKTDKVLHMERIFVKPKECNEDTNK